MWEKLISLRVWLPILILGVGAGFVLYFLGNKPEARKRSRQYSGTLVEVVRAERSSPQIEFETHGRVRAAQRVTVTAQVSGVVNWISPILDEGSFFQEGDLLMTMDPLNSENLNYTLVKAPFNGVVQVRSVDLGQNINTGTQLATLIGSDRAEVLSDVPVGQLDWLIGSDSRLVGNMPNRYELEAEISMQIGSERAIWLGRVERHLLELTPKGMMVQLILSVEDPFRLRTPKVTRAVRGNLQDKLDSKLGSVKQSKTLPPNNRGSSRKMPLFIGAFVDVRFPGKIFKNVIELPVQALRDENTVWIVRDDLLEILTVEIVHLEGDSFFVLKGLEIGELVITSPLKGAANGLKVRFPNSELSDLTIGRQKRMNRDEVGQHKVAKKKQKHVKR